MFATSDTITTSDSGYIAPIATEANNPYGLTPNANPVEGTPISVRQFDLLGFSGYSNQDIKGNLQTLDQGQTLQPSGNTWKKYLLPYTVTENTLLSFDFRSDRLGEIHAIGLDNDNDYLNSNKTSAAFALAGSQVTRQEWNTTHNNYEGTDWQSYTIEVGKFYTGNFQHLTFVNDHDITPQNSNSFYRNIRLYERNLQDVTAPTATVTATDITNNSQNYSFTVNYQDASGINLNALGQGDIRVLGPNNFNQVARLVNFTANANQTEVNATYQITSNLGWGVVDPQGTYQIQLEANQVSDIHLNGENQSQVLGSFQVNISSESYTVSRPLDPITFSSDKIRSYANQDIKGSAQVLDDGQTLQLSGNTWKRYELPYVVTANTILEFEFRSDRQGEIQGIGFDNDNDYYNNNTQAPAFMLYGIHPDKTQWNLSQKNYSGTDWKTYRLEVGKLFTGTFNALTLINDEDISTPVSNSFYRNLRLYDRNPADTTGPTVLLDPASLPVFTPGQTPYSFTVTYSDRGGINLNSLDNQDLQVIAPNGDSQMATLLNVQSNPNTPTVTATYQVTGGDQWTWTQAGAYRLQLQGNQVQDLNGNTAIAQFLGDLPVETFTAHLVTPSSWQSQSRLTFQVTYTDNLGLALNSLDNQDIVVTGPNNFQQFATFVQAQALDPQTWTATYQLNDANNGIWDARDNGLYTVTLQGNQVQSVTGKVLTTQTLGSFQTNFKEKALWFSGFENGMPGGEWLKYDNGTFSPDGQPDLADSANWTIIDQAEASALGVTPLSGDFVYQSWINQEGTRNHRAYPVLHIDPNTNADFNDYLTSPPQPIVNRFYLWLDWNPAEITKTDWLSFLTVGNNPNWNVVTFSQKGPNGTLEMAHAPWTAPERVAVPEQQWVRFTTYMDFQSNVIHVWMDGKHIFSMTAGGNLNYQEGVSTNQTPYLRRAHWGLYANAGFTGATVYNDAIQLWTVDEAITDPSQEPWSPYDGYGLNVEV
ncbi:MAG: hypothetical protein ACKO1W_04260 [Microcystaceae cyanobacterium]